MIGHLTNTAVNMMSSLKTAGTESETSIAHIHPNRRDENLINTTRTEIIQIFSKYLMGVQRVSM
jgi:hypothetical protein